jgi:hypothetical protein
LYSTGVTLYMNPYQGYPSNILALLSHSST